MSIYNFNKMLSGLVTPIRFLQSIVKEITIWTCCICKLSYSTCLHSYH